MQEAEADKTAMRAKLSQQLNTILETRDSARGLIVNMSEDGVRLHFEAELPDDFTLVIADAPRPRRSCRVVWRLGHEVGAEFNDSFKPGFAHHIARGR